MENRHISITGAREHNLRGINVEIPRNKFVVITGLSGSGKSSLAFDTIYAEGQRRYVESLSAYARQFLDQLQKPDVELIEGLPPTISIEQRTGHTTPRSTVATSTEIYDYLRLLFARIGRPYCYKCNRMIAQQTAQQIIEKLLELPAETKLTLLAPAAKGKKGTHKDVLERIKKQGFVRVRVDGKIVEFKDVPPLGKNLKHDIDILVDRLIVSQESKSRLADSVETALKVGEGLVIAIWNDESGTQEKLYSQLYACPYCNISLGEIQPRLFSFNSPYGACQKCDGLGSKLELDEDLVVGNRKLSLREGVIEPWHKLGHRMAIRYSYKLREFCTWFNISYSMAYEKIHDDKKQILLYGTKKEDEAKYGYYFEGVIPNLVRRFNETDSEFIKRRILNFMNEKVCTECNGTRLRPEALSIKISQKTIHDVTCMTVADAAEFFEILKLDKEEKHISRLILKEIKSRLKFLCDVGLNYLTLNRKSDTLAGGESQRIRLASQLGSGLVGVCYVLDEPTIGLHQRDNARLLDTLIHLRDIGNTVIVVEHDEDTIKRADHVIDMGPGAGRHGGLVVAQGTIDDIISVKDSITGRFLTEEESIHVPAKRRSVDLARSIEIKGAKEHNLKDINVRFPLGVFVVVTGVSGSGKSTLVHEITYKGLRKLMLDSKDRAGAHEAIVGYNLLDSVVIINQTPIGRTPRSNPATYTGVFDEIRKLYAITKEAKGRGYQPGRFSFNVRGGRCESCEGQGFKLIEMHFLPDVYVTCEECKGKRYNRETLEVLYKGKSIADVLSMSVEESMQFFSSFQKIVSMLRTLDDVGLGYISLGQPSTTLSGGEAQRIKLASELGRTHSGHTLYILDEPTTGLHIADIKKLLEVLNRLVDLGNTVIVIEHNMHVIKTADYIIDLGPEGGEEGGYVVASGSPEIVATNNSSYTGSILSSYLKKILPSGVRI